jgi:hypothetical protein
MYVSLQTDSGELVHLRYPGGIPGGKPLKALITPLTVYCSQLSTPDAAMIQAWFSKLESLSRKPLCDIASPLLQWADPVGDEVGYAVGPWFEAPILLKHAYAMLQVFERVDLEATWWCEPFWLLRDFRALFRAAEGAVARGATQVRLVIT